MAVDVAAASGTSVPVVGHEFSVAVGVSVLIRIHQRRLATMAIQMRARTFNIIRSTWNALSTAPSSVTKTLPTLFSMGGGARFIKVATLIAASLLVFLRPSMSGLVSCQSA